jgi:hypothetical protein
VWLLCCYFFLLYSILDDFENRACQHAGIKELYQYYCQMLIFFSLLQPKKMMQDDAKDNTRDPKHDNVMAAKTKE